MNRALLLGLLVLTIAAGGLRSSPIPAEAAGVAALTDEFDGPFASWGNVRTQYGAKGDGLADDTAALQAALNDVGVQGKPGVIYLPAGTYRITSTLTLTAKDGVAVLGQDPVTTTLRWAGSPGQDMLSLNGVAHSRFGRLTWDGVGTARAAVAHGWDGRTGFAATGNTHVDEVFTRLGFGIRGGTRFHMDSETAVIRCLFNAISTAGLQVMNYNALNWWVWDSTFQDNLLGVTNLGGAGNFSVYNSRFFRSLVADIAIGNTSQFGIRGNWSTDSNQFFSAGPIGSASARVIMQGNTVLRSATRPINFINPGPIVLVDNVLDSLAVGPLVKVKQAYVTIPDADALTLGNTVTSSTPYDVQGRLLDLDTRIVSKVTATMPPAVPTAPQVSRPVVVVAVGSNDVAIQAAIDTAVARFAGQRPVVHLPSGTYSISNTLLLPANSDLQLVGDGGTTVVNWMGQSSGRMIQVDGLSSSVTIRDLKLLSNDLTDAIVVQHADAAGGRVVVDGASVSHAASVGFVSNGLDNMVAWLRNVNYGDSQLGVQVIGGPNAQAGHPSTGRMTIIGTSAGSNEHTYEVDTGGHLVVDDAWYEAGGPGFLTLRSLGSFTLSQAQVAPNTSTSGDPPILLDNQFGPVLLQGMFLSAGNQVKVQGAGASSQALVLGSVGNDATWLTDSSAQAQFALLRSRQGTPDGGSKAYADLSRNVVSQADFVRTMMAPLRAELMQPLTATTGATNILLTGVAVQNPHSGIILQP